MTTRIQCVLYNNAPAVVWDLLEALSVTMRDDGRPTTLHLGDCSDQPVLSDSAVASWRETAGPNNLVEARYTVFGANLGFGAGHNRLWRDHPSGDRLLVINPDGLPAPHLLSRLNRTAGRHPEFGAVEARQVPIEHPRRFDPTTWETAWVSGACTLFEGAAFEEAGGFDETFFMYAEDVDLSWRLRAGGRRLYVCPDTFFVHRKRLVGRTPATSEAERYHGPLSLMLLRAKYGAHAVNERTVALLRRDRTPENVRLLANFERLRQRLTPATEQQAARAAFGPDGGPADHRWGYPLPRTLASAG